MSLHDGLHKSVFFFFEILLVKAGGGEDSLVIERRFLQGCALGLTVRVPAISACLGASG